MRPPRDEQLQRPAFSVEISFPIEPTPEAIRQLRKQVARDQFKVVDGGKSASSLRPKRRQKR